MKLPGQRTAGTVLADEGAAAVAQISDLETKWTLTLRLRWSDAGKPYADRLELAHPDDLPIDHNVLRAVSMIDLATLADEVVQHQRAGEVAGWKDVALPRSRAAVTPSDLAQAAEIARRADADNLSRVALLRRELSISERTAYRRLDAAVAAGLLEAKR